MGPAYYARNTAWILLTFATAALGANVSDEADLAIRQLNHGDFASAQKTAQQTLAAVQENRQEDTLGGAAALAAMGTVLQAEARFSEAQAMLEHALAIRERLLAPDDPLIAYTLNNLAVVYRQEGRLSDAASLYQRAVGIYQHATSKDLVAVLNNLGRVLADQGEHKEAERRFRQAISAAEKNFGPDHPETSVGLSNLGNLLVTRRKFNAAEAMLARAETIDRRNFADGHLRIGYDLNNDGNLAFARKQWARAEQLLEQSLAILEKRLPANHPDTGKVVGNLADVYRMQGRLEESEAAYRKALRMLEQAWGPESLQLLPTLLAYSQVLRARQEYAEAEALEVRSTRIRVALALRGAE